MLFVILQLLNLDSFEPIGLQLAAICYIRLYSLVRHLLLQNGLIHLAVLLALYILPTRLQVFGDAVCLDAILGAVDELATVSLTYCNKMLL